MSLTPYHFNNSVYSQKIRMVLEEKNVSDWESKEIDLFNGGQFDSEYLKLNPKGVVPTLVHNGRVMTESTLIAEYLKEIFAEPPLKPADTAERAVMRLYS
ncbi:MAG: glutathione S-transferase family protein [Rhodospirillales bacterium]|nr:glutathione S-transferase family protein [Rhodospirillales bacterium]